MLKRIISFLGIALAVASLIFLGLALHRQVDGILEIRWETMDLVVFIGASILSLLSFLLLATSWALMVEDRKQIQTNLIAAISIYARTSILKYLPGNVFHFIGRNFAAYGTDRSHARLASATMTEIVFCLLSALLLASIVFSAIPGPLPQIFFRVIAVLIIVMVSFSLVQPSFIARICGCLPKRIPTLSKSLGIALACNILGFVVIMASAAVLGLSFLPANVGAASTAAIYILAWLIGFAIPGAPGGLGVREAFIVVNLTPAAGEPKALVFALMMRLASTIGDVLFFVIGIFLSPKNPEKLD